MYSPLVSSWDALIRSGAQRRTTADVYENPTVLVAALANVPIESFSIKIDRKSGIRRTADIKIVDPDILGEMTRPGSSLEPYGTEVRLNTGLKLPGGSYSMIPAGVFQIEDLKWDQDESSLTISLFDRSKALDRSQYGVPLDASGKLASEFIQDTITDLLPYVQVVFDATSDVRFPGGTTFRAGRMQAVADAAEAMGCEAFFDVNGTARVVAIPFIDTTVSSSQYDWLVNAGEDGVLISYSRAITRKDTFNKIHVWGAPPAESTPQPYGFAVDDNPSSATYYGGRFGKADLRIERQELTSNGQCASYAIAQLRNSTGLAKSISLESLSNPALDAGDTILVRYPDGTEELHLVDGLTFTESGAMSVDTRVQTRAS